MSQARTGSKKTGSFHGRSGLAALICLALAACQAPVEVRPVVVDIIGDSNALAEPLRHERSFVAQTALAATGQGLLAFDAHGEVIAALAESWIVEEGGQSYIFRLKRAKWASGEPVKAEAVARLLRQRLKASTDLLGGLKPDVRVMTDRVIEIRLGTAIPAFLQLLAHPRLGLLGDEGGTGPYVGDNHLNRLYLQPFRDIIDDDAQAPPPDLTPNEQRTLEAGRAALTMARYQIGRTDIVLGGRFQDLLLIPTARLGATDVQADPVPGLFGLAIVGKSRFLANRDVRDALSKAVDRDELARALNLQGWTTSTTPLPAALDMARAPSPPNWADTPINERVAAARNVINGWAAAHSKPPVLRIALPKGAGATLLFYRLAADYRPLGLRLDRVGPNEPADLRLIDAVAAFDSALWYLARLDCDGGISCDANASLNLSSARNASSRVEQSILLGEAERLIVAHAGYIPLGLPIRWSLVSRRLTGFAPSPRGIHPLNLLLARPN